MKKELLSLIFCFVLVFMACFIHLGCGRKQTMEMSQSFNNAIRNIDTNSQSAADFLEQMSADTLDMNEAQRMYYNLYSIYAHDKAGRGVISVDKTSQLVDFYSDYGVDSLYLFSLYLHAGAFRDAEDIPQAVEWYIKAIDFGKGKLMGSRYLERCFNQLAYCYNHVFLPDKALDVLKEAERFVYADYAANLYKKMAQIYSNKGNSDSCWIYVMKSISVSPMEKRGNIAVTNMRYLVAQKDTLNINRYKDCLLGLKEDQLSSQYAVDIALNKALYYEFIQKSDSAAYYYSKVAECNVIPLAAQEASGRLYTLCHQQGNDAEAWKYVRRYQQLTDSVMRATESQRVAQVENMYNYQLQQKQANDELSKSNTSLKWALGVIVGLLLLMVSGFMAARVYKKRSTRKLQLSRQETEDAKRQNECLNIELESRLRENERIKKDNENLNQETVELRKSIVENEAKIEELKRMMEEGMAQVSRDSNAYLQKMKDELNKLEGELGSNLWSESSHAVDMVYPQLEANLQKYFPDLDHIYTQIVYFSCMNFGVTRIGGLTGILPQSVVKRKNRMVEKIQKSHPELKVENYTQLVTLLHGKRKFKLGLRLASL